MPACFIDLNETAVPHFVLMISHWDDVLCVSITCPNTKWPGEVQCRLMRLTAPGTNQLAGITETDKRLGDDADVGRTKWMRQRSAPLSVRPEGQSGQPLLGSGRDVHHRRGQQENDTDPLLWA